jgi:hypothetical protein
MQEMEGKPVEAVVLEEPALAACASALAQAFEEDPLQRYVLPNGDDRRRVAPRQFEASLRYGCLYGLALTTRGTAHGAAQADRVRVPCFVETVQPRNQALYERHGFRLVWEGGETWR